MEGVESGEASKKRQNEGDDENSSGISRQGRELAEVEVRRDFSYSSLMF